MTYEDTIEWLFQQETMGIKFGLSNETELLGHLGDPHLKFRSVHVAGTNGKGSVCAMTSSVLREAGYRTGLYTSPHLVDFKERINVDGECIPEHEFLRLAEEVREISDRMSATSKEKRLTFFELTTAMAFAHFADSEVEQAVIEVGMGGRLDATNVIVPQCSVITKISLEHTEYLGRTIAAIAGEKAGIIKKGIPVITIDQSEEALTVFRERSLNMRADLKVVGSDVGYELISSSLEGTDVYLDELDKIVHIPLIGSYQADNLALSVGCISELMKKGTYVPDDAILNGLSNAVWPGRLDMVSRDPLVIFDVTHTPDGARVVSEEIKRLIGDDLILVLGVLKDKDLESIASYFGKVSSSAIATSPRTKRAFPAEDVEAALAKFCPKVERIDDVGTAVGTAIRSADKGDAVLVTGSLYTIGEAMRWWNERKAC